MQAELVHLKWQHYLELWRLQEEASEEASEVEVVAVDATGSVIVGGRW